MEGSKIWGAVVRGIENLGPYKTDPNLWKLPDRNQVDVQGTRFLNASQLHDELG